MKGRPTGRLDRETSSDRLDREIRLGLHVYRHYTCMHARIIRVCIPLVERLVLID